MIYAGRFIQGLATGITSLAGPVSFINNLSGFFKSVLFVLLVKQSFYFKEL